MGDVMLLLHPGCHSLTPPPSPLSQFPSPPPRKKIGLEPPFSLLANPNLREGERNTIAGFASDICVKTWFFLSSLLF